MLQRPGDMAARGRMLLGASLAGSAIENSMLGAVHAAANPLTAKFNIVHGQAVGMLLPAVVRLNAADPAVAVLYQDLARGAGLSTVDDLVVFLRQTLKQAGIPESLTGSGVQEADVQGLAEDANRQWTARFNPVPVDVATFSDLYRSIL